MKRLVKILAVVMACVLVGGILVVGNAFVGNPISKLLATNTANRHLKEQYGNTDYQLQEVNYSFKTGGYYAKIQSPSSPDTYFSLHISSGGKLQWDSYEDMVTSGRNTLSRLDTEYRQRVNAVFEAEDFPYKSDIAGGSIQEKWNVEVDSMGKNFGVDAETLVLDKTYDMEKIAESYGRITFYAQDEEVTIQRASEILLHITQILKENNIPFYAISFVLQKPREEGVYPTDATQINVVDFLYVDIYAEGLEERMEKAHQELNAYYAQQDKQKDTEQQGLTSSVE